MCGIVAYIGRRTAWPIVIEGLKRLAYRGYDSSGVAWIDATGLQCEKVKGSPSVLEKALHGRNIIGTAMIGHNRWATHGEPSAVNAHPHIDCSGRFAVVHNGVIENYLALKAWLKEKGHIFFSSTDTEVLAHLVEELYAGDLWGAVWEALELVKGAYGIAVLSSCDPRRIICARQGSPLALGRSAHGVIVASDNMPILPHTKEIAYLEDGQLAEVSEGDYRIYGVERNEIDPEIVSVEEDLKAIEKGRFKHYMQKEIFEQPQSIKETMRGRVKPEGKTVKLGGVENLLDYISSKQRIILTACGTSWHACLVGEYLLEEFLDIPVEVEYASEFRYRKTPLDDDVLVIAISQSGETKDTLAAIQKARRHNILTMGICNVVGSSVARETDCGIYLHAGPEIGVASTKAFTAQVAVLVMFALLVARRKGSDIDGEVIRELFHIPEKIQEILGSAGKIEKIAEKFAHARNFLYLGRGCNFPVALEGALKLKEISYIHAEGYPAAEMKHGPIALIDEDMPVVFIAPQDEVYDKVVSNMEEVKARGGRIITVATADDKRVQELSEEVIYIPRTVPFLTPFLSVVPLQLLAYYIAVLKGLDIDRPRHLAKSVTVE